MSDCVAEASSASSCAQNVLVGPVACASEQRARRERRARRRPARTGRPRSPERHPRRRARAAARIPGPRWGRRWARSTLYGGAESGSIRAWTCRDACSTSRSNRTCRTDSTSSLQTARSASVSIPAASKPSRSELGCRPRRPANPPLATPLRKHRQTRRSRSEDRAPVWSWIPPGPSVSSAFNCPRNLLQYGRNCDVCRVSVLAQIRARGADVWEAVRSTLRARRRKSRVGARAPAWPRLVRALHPPVRTDKSLHRGSSTRTRKSAMPRTPSWTKGI